MKTIEIGVSPEEVANPSAVDVYCNRCRDIRASYHCPICVDFHLCDNCYPVDFHAHAMHYVEPRDNIEAIQRLNQTLVHYGACHNGNCARRFCKKTKEEYQHLLTCPKLHGCPRCRAFFDPLRFHAQRCRVNSCRAFLCVQLNAEAKPVEVEVAVTSDSDGEVGDDDEDESDDSSVSDNQENEDE